MVLTVLVQFPQKVFKSLSVVVMQLPHANIQGVD